MRFRHVTVVHVPLDLAYGWWTSFSEEDGSEEGPLLSRRIPFRMERGLLIEDEYAYLNRRFTLKGRVKIRPPDSYWVEYYGEIVQVRLKYMFASVVEGTQLVVLGDVRGKGWLKAFLPLFWPRIKREMIAGIDSNVRMVEGLSQAHDS
ncbi:MAG: hypothetical protein ACE5HJ_01690 [Thermoplasmata archaeon]